MPRMVKQMSLNYENERRKGMVTIPTPQKHN